MASLHFVTHKNIFCSLADHSIECCIVSYGAMSLLVSQDCVVCIRTVSNLIGLFVVSLKYMIVPRISSNAPINVKPGRRGEGEGDGETRPMWVTLNSYTTY